MDTTSRLITKSITWQICGFISMGLIGYLFTGSITASSGIALTGSLAGFGSYFLHEMAWSKVRWGQKQLDQIPVGEGIKITDFAPVTSSSATSFHQLTG